jgi:ubiquinone/menaquinone biosynthesis C-methylase UbiE
LAEKFEPHNRGKLESEERKRLLAPHNTLLMLGYQPNDSMADIGCGIGLFTFQAAEIGGQNAKIYAIDISDIMLSEVEKRAQLAGYHNIVPLKSDEYDFKLKNGSVDFVLICTVLHEVDDKTRFLKEASRICRKDGIISVVEFNETKTDFGPPLHHRVKREEATKLLYESGFRSAVDFDINGAFYAIRAIKE